jgi:predicted O-methyltransferase YrrM
MKDLENDAEWLGRLRRLNQVVESAGEPLTGNLFYDHLQEDYVDAPPIAIMRPKRDRFRRAVEGRRRLLEIGVNGGHSAYLALTSNPTLEFHGVDICTNGYVIPAVEWLHAEFPGRVFFYEGSSLDVVPELARRGERFDCFHVDGAKYLYYMDVLNCGPMIADDGAILIMDDVQLPVVGRAWNRCVRERLVQSCPEFPPMAHSLKYRQEIGSMNRVSRSRWLAYHNAANIGLALRPMWPHVERVARRVTSGPLQRVANRFGYTIVLTTHLNWLNEVLAEGDAPASATDGPSSAAA